MVFVYFSFISFFKKQNKTTTTKLDTIFSLGIEGLYPDTDPLCHLTDRDCLPLGDSSLLTPIDRLYSMQDSYFT